jgi:hypothetical protein
MNTPNPITVTHCPDCGEPLDYYLQELHPLSTRTPNWIGTCKTVGCTLEGTTLSDEGWQTVNLDEYRAMRAAQVNGYHRTR